MRAWRSVLGLVLTVIQLIVAVIFLIQAVVSDNVVRWFVDFSGLTFSSVNYYQVDALDLSANVRFLGSVLILLLFGYVLIVFVPGWVKKKELEPEEMDEFGFLED
jgi:H+/Cl- antiporter ClcA